MPAAPSQGGAYRKDIDGLRAVAVAAVILYHLSVPGFSGGLVGVDIFFVISGFVITQLLLRLSSDNPMREFYERRVRRLAPALIVVLLASTAAAYFFLLPADFEQFSKSLLATALCVSNFFFARQVGDYFAVDASTKPLLHTWSLAVEEQFYLLYPAALLFLMRHKVSESRISTSLLLIAAASLLMACAGQWLFPAYSFFLLPTRAWELLLGALVATAPVRAPSPPMAHAASLVGLACVICGVTGALQTNILPAPSIACIGAALIIYSGRSAVSARLLSLKPFTACGLVSYSLYLWHWPIIVFYKYAITPTLGIYDAVLIVGLTVSAATISYIVVEQPIRSRRLLPRRVAIFSFAGAGSGLLLLASVTGLATHGLPQRLSPAVVRFANGSKDVNPDRAKCIGSEPENTISGHFCRLGNANGEPSLLVWGDSHGDPWMPVFDDFAMKHNISGIIAVHGGCPPLLGVRRPDQTPAHRCREFNNAVFVAIQRFQVKRVVLIGRWSWYVHGTESHGMEEGDGPLLALDDNQEADTKEKVFRTALTETVTQLRKLGVNILVINQPPTYTFDVPRELAYAAIRGSPAKGLAPDAVSRQYAFQLDVFSDNHLNVLDAAGYLCRDPQRDCEMQRDGRSLYADFNHLSVYGARTIAEISGIRWK